jgi:glycosyltransferase involved in cell wall biosynthesis
MKKKLKVMQIIPNLALGGAEIMVENLSYALDNEGVDVKIVSLYTYSSPITERLKKCNIHVYFLGKRKGFDIRILLQLFKLFYKEKPDVIHSHLYATTYSIPAAILAGIRIRVHTIHSIANKEINSFKRKIYKFFYKYCKVIPVAISSKVKDTFYEEYKLPKISVPLIYNGINFARCETKHYGPNPPNIINIVHVASFKEAKNHSGLIDSFKIVHKSNPSTTLTLIGTGPLEEKIKDKVRDLELENSVVFLGAMDNVFPFLNEADIFVLPSLWEGMPMTLIEAMGTGLPIVATNVGGIPDMIEDKFSGLLVDVNIEEIAKAILDLSYNYELRKEIGHNAKSQVERFSAKIMAVNYLNLYLANDNKEDSR